MLARRIDSQRITFWSAIVCALIAAISVALSDNTWISYYKSTEEFAFESRRFNIERCMPLEVDDRARSHKIYFLDGFPSWVEINGRRTYSCESTPKCSCGSEKHCYAIFDQVRGSEVCLSVAGEYPNALRRRVALLHVAAAELGFGYRLVIENWLAILFGSLALFLAGLTQVRRRLVP
jgi:hypothetical protein